MEIKQDRSYGVIPIFQTEDGKNLYCLVKHALGHWAFPKGHQDKGETNEETALRELKEETGIENAELDLGKVFYERYTFEIDDVKYEKVVEFYLGRVGSMEGDTQDNFKHEIHEIAWKTYEESIELLTYPETKCVLEEVNRYLNGK